MGIKGLMKFISDHAPRAIKEVKYESFTGRKLAIDASMSLYQFMIAIRDGENFANLTNEHGETTSHIAGMLSRVIRFLEHGIKPVYVFDGKPPELKTGELLKRTARRAEAEEELAKAKEAGNQEDMKKFVSRTVRVTKQHNDDVKTLLRLMGIPIVDAPCDAEPQCARLNVAGKVYGTGTDDMDALTFGAPIQVRHLSFSDKKAGNAVLEVHLDVLLEETKLTMEEFVDFCILCGCDYCDTIKGIGPGTAYKLIKEHRNIETIIEKIDKTKHPLPDRFPFKEVREYFLKPDVIPAQEVELVWKEPDFEALKKYLVETHNFSEQRVTKQLERLKKSKEASSQSRLESFFGAVTVKVNEKARQKEAEAKAKAKAAAKAGGLKRKAPEAKSSTAKKMKP